MDGQGGPVLQVGEIVDVDDGDRGLAVPGASGSAVDAWPIRRRAPIPPRPGTGSGRYGRQLPSSLESCKEMPVTVGNLDRHFSSTATSASLAWLIW
jgi:hypothetical protein